MLRSGDFGITLSKVLTAEDILATFRSIIPAGLQIDVFPTPHTPDEVGAVWAWLEETLDPNWPCVVNVVCGSECQLGDYPDLRLAEYLSQSFSCHALTETYPFAGDLDLHDPYWVMAYIDRKWYLADTVNTPLMGVDMDGEEIGNEAIKLVRPLTIPDIHS
jgi:hypothetical protein